MKKFQRELARLIDPDQFRYLGRAVTRPDTIRMDGNIVCTNSDLIGADILKQLYKNTFEGAERELIRRHLRASDRVLEIGAGMGVVSMLIVSICGEKNLVSYEANAGMRELLEKNFAANNMSPELRFKCVAPVAGEIEFFVNESFVSSSTTKRASSMSKTVQADNLSDVIRDFQPTTIVMDAEGSEIELFACISKNSSVKKIIAELHPHIVGENEIENSLEYLRSIGFQKKDSSRKTVYLQR